MTDNNKRTWFECTDGNGGWSYPTMKEALKQRMDMRKGFPDNKYMSESNRKYWILSSSRYHITKVEQITTQLV